MSNAVSSRVSANNHEELAKLHKAKLEKKKVEEASLFFFFAVVTVTVFAILFFFQTEYFHFHLEKPTR